MKTFQQWATSPVGMKAYRRYLQSHVRLDPEYTGHGDTFRLEHCHGLLVQWQMQRELTPASHPINASIKRRFSMVLGQTRNDRKLPLP